VLAESDVQTAGEIHQRLVLRVRIRIEERLQVIEEVRREGLAARNEVHRQFQRLPNPDLVMYVYPHLAGTDPVPVPGYTTVFPLYQRIQYAMPGERVEDY